MDVQQALDFIRANPRAVLATARRDGSPQMSPVVAAVDAEGRIVVSSRETAMKTRNLRRNPTCWLMSFTEGFFGPWVQVTGEVRVQSLPAAMDTLVDYYRRISGDHPDWTEYRDTMRSERRVALLLTPTAAGPDVSG